MIIWKKTLKYDFFFSTCISLDFFTQAAVGINRINHPVIFHLPNIHIYSLLPSFIQHGTSEMTIKRVTPYVYNIRFTLAASDTRKYLSPGRGTRRLVSREIYSNKYASCVIVVTSDQQKKVTVFFFFFCADAQGGKPTRYIVLPSPKRVRLYSKYRTDVVRCTNYTVANGSKK